MRSKVCLFFTEVIQCEENICHMSYGFEIKLDFVNDRIQAEAEVVPSSSSIEVEVEVEVGVRVEVEV